MEMIRAEHALEEWQQRLRRVETEERREPREDERRQGFGAASPDWNPIVRCVRSQNGRVFD